MSRACCKLEQKQSYVQTEENWSSSQIIAAPVERPLVYSPLISIKENSLPVPTLPEQIEWAGPQITKFSALGHQVTFLQDFFSSLSMNDCTALGLAMNTAATLAKGKVHSGDSSVLALNASPLLQSRNAPLDDDIQLLDDDAGNAAVVCTGYEPSSRRRRAIVANSRRAAFFDMHSEEMLARAAVCELQPPFIEWDALLLCLHMSVAELFRSSRKSELYQRMYLGSSGHRRAQLVAGRLEEARDDLDRVVEVRRVRAER